MIVGCGNALLSEDMYKDGFENIYNIDISNVVIRQMKQRNNLLENMKYEVMDATDLKYQDNYFDAIIDKATIDTLLCSSNPD